MHPPCWSTVGSTYLGAVPVSGAGDQKTVRVDDDRTVPRPHAAPRARAPRHRVNKPYEGADTQLHERVCALLQPQQRFVGVISIDMSVRISTRASMRVRVQHRHVRSGRTAVGGHRFVGLRFSRTTQLARAGADRVGDSSHQPDTKHVHQRRRTTSARAIFSRDRPRFAPPSDRSTGFADCFSTRR